MMQIKEVTPGYSVSDQVHISDLDAVAAQGIKTIINNRPDNEAKGQPDSADIAAAVEALGLRYFHIPVSGPVSKDTFEAFQRAYTRAHEPILAFCMTGTRSTMMWALAEVKTRDVDTVLADTLAAGYDLSRMRANLVAQSGTPSNTQ